MEKRLSGIDMPFDPLADSDDDEASFAPSQYLEDAEANPADIFEKDASLTPIQHNFMKPSTNLMIEVGIYCKTDG